MLDREVADAAPRVDRLGRDERARRAARKASGAGAAARAHGLVDRQLGRREQRPEEDPRARTRVGQQVRVLADPAEPGPGRQRTLRQRPIVDVRDVAGRQSRGAKVGGERLEPMSQRDVVVGPERVARNPPHRRRTGAAASTGASARRSASGAGSQAARSGPAYGAATTITDLASGSWARGSVARRGRSPPIHSMRAMRPAPTLSSIRARASGSGAASVTPTSSSPWRAASSARRARVTRRAGERRTGAAPRSERCRPRPAAWRPAGSGSRRPIRGPPPRWAPTRCARHGRR